MSGNTIGKVFCVTSFGESHGPAIGCVVDGCPPGMELSSSDIQQELDRRKRWIGSSAFSSDRASAFESSFVNRFNYDASQTQFSVRSRSLFRRGFLK